MVGAHHPGESRLPDLARAADLMRSDPAGAEALAREILAAHPQSPEARLVLATALRLQGAKLEALALLEPLAEAEAASWLAHAELGQALFALGRSRAALGPIGKATALNPDWALGWRLLADIHLFAGDFASAHAADDQYLRAVVTNPPLRAAVAAIAARRLDDAEAELRPLLAAHPNSAAVLHLAGEVTARRGRLPEAAQLFSDALRAAPDFDLARLSLTGVLEQLARCVDALGLVDHLLSRVPGSLRCRILKTWILREIGDFAGMLDLVQSLLAEMPDQPRGWLICGEVLRNLGRAEESSRAFKTALALDPLCTEAWSNLGDMKSYRFDADETRAMETLLAGAGLSPKDHANLHYALGKAREDERAWDGAFSHYARGAALELELRGPGVALDGLVERAKALFTPAFFAERAGWGCPATDPIFIVGMPRSGSTLLEQILASHPAVEGVRELLEIPLIADFVSGRDRDAYPGALASKPRALFDKLGRDYLEWTRPFRRLGRARFIDKAPINFLHVGLIRLILPRAKVIDIRRHPLDCGLSAFKHNFKNGWEATYDLARLGRFYADYVELMAHYDAVLPGFVHRVSYEALVSDTEAQVRALLAWLGLPFDAACLRFFETPRAVTTPSAEQVRRPISTEAVGYWRNFDAHLGPLKAALGPVLDTYPVAP